MSVTRRGVLGGLMAGAALPVWGESIRPMPRPMPSAMKEAATSVNDTRDLVAAAKLTGITGYIVADVATGRVLEQVNADAPVPPASVAKTVTALFALEKLGADLRFTTRVMAAGSVQGGRLSGDLVLAGGGDPTLDSDKLGDLVAALAATGLREVTGRFLAYAGALPSFDRITDEQPIQVGYDPGLSGLLLNFNRVNFEWTKGGATTQMNARGERYVPVVKMARMVWWTGPHLCSAIRRVPGSRIGRWRGAHWAKRAVAGCRCGRWRLMSQRCFRRCARRRGSACRGRTWCKCCLPARSKLWRGKATT